MVSSSVKKLGVLTLAVSVLGGVIYNQNTGSIQKERKISKPSQSIIIESNRARKPLVANDSINRKIRSERLSVVASLEIPQGETKFIKYQPYIDGNVALKEVIPSDFSKYSRRLLKRNAKASIQQYYERKARQGEGFVALISPDELIRAHTHDLKMQALEKQWVQRSRDENLDPFQAAELSSANKLLRESSNKAVAAAGVSDTSYLGDFLAFLQEEKFAVEEDIFVAQTRVAPKRIVVKGKKNKVVFKSRKKYKETKVVRLTGKKKKTPMKLHEARKKMRDASKSNSYVTAYAPSKKHSDAPFGKVIVDGKRNATLDVNKGDHDWVKNPLPRYVASSSEQRCLANGIYFEARGESEKGMAAVAQVILNRVKNPAYPKTICGVVYQNKRLRNRCQFSFACDGIPDLVLSRTAYSKAKRIAKQSITGKLWIKAVGSSTHYHATYVRPRWANTMKRMKRIGLHIFYRTYGGGWS